MFRGKSKRGTVLCTIIHDTIQCFKKRNRNPFSLSVCLLLVDHNPIEENKEEIISCFCLVGIIKNLQFIIFIFVCVKFTSLPRLSVKKVVTKFRKDEGKLMK